MSDDDVGEDYSSSTPDSGTLDARTSVVDGEISALRTIIRSRIDAGELPCDLRTDRCWAGRGGGGRCSGCDQPITADENEYEIAGNEAEVTPDRLVFHRRCLDIWIVECRQRV